MSRSVLARDASIRGRLLVVIDVEKVRIKQGLDDSCQDGNRLERTLKRSLGEVSEHPIGNVEGPVETQSKQVVRGDRIRLSGPLEHEQLRQNGNRLQPD